MIKPSDCLSKYGEPTPNFERKFMVLWDVPNDINASIPVIPNKIYCNKDMVGKLETAFRNLMSRFLTSELKTWDGCFNIRKQRGASSPSMHSWGVAIDLNAAWNGLGKEPQLSAGFVKCFTDAGFDWGGDFRSRKDGMHFQLSSI